ncbi:MAG TPA: FHA domain-containing protein [Woeseiaceae bacterium]|nr:FHA domain-containing protein [Woeseiaceae bacterium]
MDLASAGLSEQPFRTHGRPLALIPYGAHRAAVAALEAVRTQALGVGFLQGPPLSGKSTVLREFVGRLPDEIAVAQVDGSTYKTVALLESILQQFGYEVEYNSTGELAAILRVFTLQQAARHRSPVVIVENTHLLSPAAVRAVADLAALQTRQTSAIKLILASDRPLAAYFGEETFEDVAFRVARDIHLRPLRIDETAAYLHAKLRAAGSRAPTFIFPQSVCNELWHASGGWPGVVDRLALLALAKADTLPVPANCVEHPSVSEGTWDPEGAESDGTEDDAAASAPVLYVSKDGSLLQEVPVRQARLLVGRSEHNDLAIDSRFVSRHHLLLVRAGASTYLMDLNSTNGTFVNSRRVSNLVLMDNDVIALGHYRIKFSDPDATRRGTVAGAELADTVIMKTLDDMRALLAREHTELVPAPSENLPTLGGQVQ